MIFITSKRKLHLFGNFWTFNLQNTEYKYMCTQREREREREKERERERERERDLRKRIIYITNSKRLYLKTRPKNAGF